MVEDPLLRDSVQRLRVLIPTQKETKLKLFQQVSMLKAVSIYPITDLQFIQLELEAPLKIGKMHTR